MIILEILILFIVANLKRIKININSRVKINLFSDSTDATAPLLQTTIIYNRRQ